MPQVEQQGVPAAGDQERDLPDHLDARTVQSVDEYDRAPALRGGHPPAPKRNGVIRVEGQLLKGQPERSRGQTPVLLVRELEPSRGGHPAEPVGHQAKHEYRIGADQ
mgnify:CR=1 FL=1